MRTTALLSFLLTIIVLHDQAPAFGQATFSKAYGFTGVGGIEAVPGTRDFLLCNSFRYGVGNIDGFSFHRLDSAGNIVQTRSYSAGSLANVMQDGAIPMVRSDGTYSFLFGNHAWNSTNGSIRIFSTHPDGEMIWNRRIECAQLDQGIEYLEANNFHESPDGGYVIAGTRRLTEVDWTGLYAPLVIKLDGSGNVEWNKTFQMEDSCAWRGFSDVGPTGDILLGFNSSPHCSFWSPDPFITKISSEGVLLWSKRLTGLNGRFTDCLQQEDGYLILGADSVNFQLIRINGDGEPIWTNSYALNQGWVWKAPVCVPTIDGGFVLASGVTEDGVSSDILMLKVDADGALIWVELFDSQNSFQSPTHLLANEDGSLVSISYFQSFGSDQPVGTMLRRIEEGGYNQCASNMDQLLTMEELDVEVIDVTLTDLEIPMVSQSLYINDSLSQGIGLPVDTCNFNFIQTIDDLGSPMSLNVQPNPFSDRAVLDLGQDVADAYFLLYSVRGEEVRRQRISSRYTTILKSELSPGLYLFRVLRRGSDFAVGRMIIE